MFQKKTTHLLVDPVMGDNGKPYGIYSKQLCEQMKRLAMRADIITPNLTELCLLADASYKEVEEIQHTANRLERICEIGRSLCNTREKTVLATGIIYEERGRMLMGNMCITEDRCQMSAKPYQRGSYSGTGDLFASTIIGGVVRGDCISDTVNLAEAFLGAALKDSVLENIPRNDGINYEQFLTMLAK